MELVLKELVLVLEGQELLDSGADVPLADEAGRQELVVVVNAPREVEFDGHEQVGL